MKTILFGTALALVTTVASASPNGTYKMHGVSHVRATSSLKNVDKTYPTDGQAIVSGPDDAVRIDFTTEGSKCSLLGKRSGNTINLVPGQRCTQHVSRDGVRGQLNAVLSRGWATTVGITMTLQTRWNFKGKVHVLFQQVDVTGSMESTMKGTRTAS